MTTIPQGRTPVPGLSSDRPSTRLLVGLTTAAATVALAVGAPVGSWRVVRDRSARVD